MNLEEKKALGYLIRRYRERLNWTQEDLESQSGVKLRTIQRAEGGYGINAFNLGGIAEALDMDAAELRRQAEKTSSQPPAKRISLREVDSAQDLVDLLRSRIEHGWSLEIGLPDEHPYNEMVGEDILELDGDLEHHPKSAQDRISHLRCAQFIISMCRQMGFGLFADNYVEQTRIKNRTQRKKATLMIVGPQADPRIVRTRSGKELDVVRDSRRLLLGGMMSGHATTYNWLEHQLLSKSDGEERVKDAFRRIMAEVLSEVNQADEEARQTK